MYARYATHPRQGVVDSFVHISTTKKIGDLYFMNAAYYFCTYNFVTLMFSSTQGKHNLS
jgi:hypothetical protein